MTSIDYLFLLHELAVKQWFDCDLIQHWQYYDKNRKRISIDISDINSWFDWKKYKKLSESDYIIADYFPYLQYLLQKWSTLPKI